MSTTPNLLISHIAESQNLKEVTANTAFDDFDGAMNSAFTATFADADYTPTNAQALYNAVFSLAGTNTAIRKFILPAERKFYLMKNATSDGHGIHVVTSAGGSTGPTILPSDGYAYMYSDGTNVTLLWSYAAGNQGASVDLFNQSAAITPTTAYTVPAGAGGLYAISYAAKQVAIDTISCSLGGVNGFQVEYTDADDSTTPTTSAGPTDSANTDTAQVNGVVFVNAKAGSNIQFSFGYTTGSAGPSAFVMEYNLHIRVKKV
jgi:hypothetical protein